MADDAKANAERFMKALHALEEGGDAGAMAGQFADDATLMALVSRRTHEGVDGARAFWEEYLKPFERVHSEFGYVRADGDHAVLEWTGKGTLAGDGGSDVEYQGVSLLEFDGAGKVRRFRTYYDSAAFVHASAGSR